MERSPGTYDVPATFRGLDLIANGIIYYQKAEPQRLHMPASSAEFEFEPLSVTVDRPTCKIVDYVNQQLAEGKLINHTNYTDNLERYL